MKELSTRIVHAIERLPRAVRALVRTWQGIVILVVLVAQLLIPITYYVARRDPHDERFAWRMFSPMRMTKCTPRFSLDEKPVDLTAEFHEAWIEIARRGRFNVIEAMGAKLCEKHPGSQVHVIVDCQYVGRPAATWGGYDMCKVPFL